MNKPELITKTISYYNFFECRDYIKKKYKFTDDTIREFWFDLIQWGDISNDAFFYMSFQDISDHVEDVYKAFKKEFCPEGKTSVQFYVSW